MADLNPYPGTIKQHTVEGREPGKVETNRWYRLFDEVRAALGDQCVLDSTPDEVIRAVRELAEFVRNNGRPSQRT